MANYDTQAREVWQRFIKDVKPKIETIHLISQHFLIRVGASTIGMFAGIKITTWANMEEIAF